MKRYAALLLIVFLLAACRPAAITLPTPTVSQLLQAATDTLPAPTATLEAQTLAVPTFTPPASVAACKAQDITASLTTDVATGSLTFSLKLTNSGQAVCRMPNPPKISLLPAGKTAALQLNPYYSCFLCDRTAAGTPTPNPTAQAERFASLMAETVDLKPGESVRLFLIWSNWCGTQVPNLDLGFKLETENLIVHNAASVNPPCLADGAPSSLMISQYIH